MGTARQKVAPLPVLRSWDEVDCALKEIGKIDAKVEEKNARHHMKVTRLKEALEDETKSYLQQKARLTKDIEEFSEANKGFLPGKSITLNFGTLGFRKSTKLIIKNVKKAIETLKERGLFDCILVKESVNKDVLRQYEDDLLKEVGAKRSEKDVFWYEVDMGKIVDTAANS